MGFLPHSKNNVASLPNCSHVKSSILELKDQHSKETWSISNKPTVKQVGQDLHNHFYSQRNIHVFIPSLSIPITFYRFYLITSNMSNTRFHYTSVFTFLKRNTDNSDPNIPIRPSLGSSPKPRHYLEFQKDSDKTQASEDITSPTFCFEEEAGAVEGVLHRQRPDENTPLLPSCYSLQERSLQVRGNNSRSEWRLQDKQDSRGVASAS